MSGLRWPVHLFSIRAVSQMFGASSESTALAARERTGRMKSRWSHGASGYQNHGCRCSVCKNAWSQKYRELNRQRDHARKLTVAPPAETLTSWWIGIPQAGLTAYVEKEHQSRMHQSSLGHGRGRPISTVEIER